MAYLTQIRITRMVRSQTKRVLNFGLQQWYAFIRMTQHMVDIETIGKRHITSEPATSRTSKLPIKDPRKSTQSLHLDSRHHIMNHTPSMHSFYETTPARAHQSPYTQRTLHLQSSTARPSHLKYCNIDRQDRADHSSVDPVRMLNIRGREYLPFRD